MKPRNFPGRKLLRRAGVMARAGVPVTHRPSTSGVIKDVRFRVGRKRRDRDGRAQ